MDETDQQEAQLTLEVCEESDEELEETVTKQETIY